jgi:hypothetical protein
LRLGGSEAVNQCNPASSRSVRWPPGGPLMQEFKRQIAEKDRT